MSQNTRIYEARKQQSDPQKSKPRGEKKSKEQIAEERKARPALIMPSALAMTQLHARVAAIEAAMFEHGILENEADQKPPKAE